MFICFASVAWNILQVGATVVSGEPKKRLNTRAIGLGREIVQVNQVDLSPNLHTTEEFKFAAC